MGKRYVIRLLGIPAKHTKQMLEEEFTKENIGFKTIFFASMDSVYSAGFAFVEFDCEEDMQKFSSIYIRNSHGDSIYMTD